VSITKKLRCSDAVMLGPHSGAVITATRTEADGDRHQIGRRCDEARSLYRRVDRLITAVPGNRRRPLTRRPSMATRTNRTGARGEGIAAARAALARQVLTPADFQALYRQFQKAVTERGHQAELTQHLGYPVGGERSADGNAREGTTPKTILTETGAVAVDVPRDRAGSFTPQFVPTGVRRLPGFDDSVLQLYAGDIK